MVNVFIGNSTYSTNLCCNSQTTTTTAATVATNAGTTNSATNLATTSDSQGTAVYGACSPSKLYVPHPTDCNKLIKCTLVENSNTYTETVETCPGGTLFNPSLSVCDWPQNVICQTYTYATVTTITTTTVPTTTSKSTINGT